MYCPSCGSEITVELKYCNRCGANLSLPAATVSTMVAAPPIRLAVPSIVLGMTIVTGLGITFGGVAEFAKVGMNPAAIAWIVLFSTATLFGCVAMMIRFWTKMVTLQRETITIPSVASQPARQQFVERPTAQQLPPRLEGVPSVTENTTRTLSAVYSEPSDRGTR
jgi:hypothetical protein